MVLRTRPDGTCVWVDDVVEPPPLTSVEPEAADIPPVDAMVASNAAGSGGSAVAAIKAGVSAPAELAKPLADADRGPESLHGAVGVSCCEGEMRK